MRQYDHLNQYYCTKDPNACVRYNGNKKPGPASITQECWNPRSDEKSRIETWNPGYDHDKNPPMQQPTKECHVNSNSTMNLNDLFNSGATKGRRQQSCNNFQEQQPYADGFTGQFFNSINPAVYEQAPQRRTRRTSNGTTRRTKKDPTMYMGGFGRLVILNEKQ